MFFIILKQIISDLYLCKYVIEQIISSIQTKNCTSPMYMSKTHTHNTHTHFLSLLCASATPFHTAATRPPLRWLVTLVLNTVNLCIMSNTSIKKTFYLQQKRKNQVRSKTRFLDKPREPPVSLAACSPSSFWSTSFPSTPWSSNLGLSFSNFTQKMPQHHPTTRPTLADILAVMRSTVEIEHMLSNNVKRGIVLEDEYQSRLDNIHRLASQRLLPENLAY